MQKPAFFAIVGFSLLVTAVCLGYSVSRYLSARFFAPPPPPRHAAQAPKDNRARDLPPDRWTNVFAPTAGMDIPSRLAKQSGGGAGAASGSSATAYVLLGTVASNTPSARRAVLWAEGMKEPIVAREHAELEPGVRVTEIGREYVWIRRGAVQERLELLPVGAKTKTASTSARRAAPVAARRIAAHGNNSSLHVDKIGENTFALDEASVTQLTSNINQFMTQVRIIPYFERNKSAGYRLAAMRPGSAFDQLGFRGGDVIQRVNNLDLSSPEKLYTIFQNLKDEKRVTVDILRHGQKSTLTYEIR